MRAFFHALSWTCTRAPLVLEGSANMAEVAAECQTLEECLMRIDKFLTARGVLDFRKCWEDVEVLVFDSFGCALFSCSLLKAPRLG